MTFSLASVRRKSSAAAMCSITCATDQRSAAGLKFHCASDSPFVASRTFFFVVSRYCSALSFSACVTSCADTAAAPAIKSNAISTPTRDLVLIFFLSLSFASAAPPGGSRIAPPRARRAAHQCAAYRGAATPGGGCPRRLRCTRAAIQCRPSLRAPRRCTAPRVCSRLARRAPHLRCSQSGRHRSIRGRRGFG